VRPFLEAAAPSAPRWSAAALARLARVPEMVRRAVRLRVEAAVEESGSTEVTLEAVEATLADSRKAMHRTMRAGGHKPSGTRKG
jgi:hypothetical protein